MRQRRPPVVSETEETPGGHNTGVVSVQVKTETDFKNAI